MPVLERGHHVLDRPDFSWGQSMGRCVRTGRLIVKRTRVLQPSPCMEPTRRQSQKPQDRSQRHILAGTIHGAQDPDLGASVGQTLVGQLESRASKEDKGEPKECGELLHASPELQDFLVERQRPQVRHVQAHHDLRCLAEPPTGRRARDSETRGDGHVSGVLDKAPKAMVVAVLQAGRGRHGHDHRPFPHAAQLLEDVGERPPP